MYKSERTNVGVVRNMTQGKHIWVGDWHLRIGEKEEGGKGLMNMNYSELPLC